MKKDKHLIFSSVDYTTCSTDNNCISILIDYGSNVPPLAEGEDESSRVIIDRARMVLSERCTSQKQFTALKSKDTFYSVLKFKTGAVIIVGLQQTDLTDLCVIKATSAICDTMEYPITIKEVSIVNMVSTFNRFNLNFQGLCSFFNRHCVAYNHNPENFPGMFFKINVPKIKSKRMDRFKNLGAYYTQVALESMAAETKSEKQSIIKKRFRVKTVLVFKVGKCTVLGQCGGEDVSIISRLLFGFFHYFMDHNIKMSEEEIIATRKKYNIPPLEWYMFVDVFLHAHYYNKPSIETLRKAMADDPDREPLDVVFFGPRQESASSTMSSNRIPSLAETIDTVRTLKRQKVTVNYLHEKEELSAKMAESIMNSRRKPWWEGKKNRAKNTRRVRPLLSSMDASSVGRNSEWFMTKHEQDYNKIMKLIDEELNESLISAGYRSPFSSAASYTISSSFLHGSRVSQTKKIRHEHRVKLARLNTSFEIFKFLSRELTSGSTPELARLFGTDVYSLLALIESLPLSKGHYTAMRERFGDDYNLTPGVIFFNRILNGNRKRCLEDDEEMCSSHDTVVRDYNIDKDKRVKRTKRYTPSDFIEAVTSFDEDGISKVGIKFNVMDIINTLNNEVFVPSDSPTANYRTCLHANYQAKMNLCRLLAMMLNDGDDITEEEVKMIRKALDDNTSSHLLANHAHGNNGLCNDEEDEEYEDEVVAAMAARKDICEDFLEKDYRLVPVCKCCHPRSKNK